MCVVGDVPSPPQPGPTSALDPSSVAPPLEPSAPPSRLPPSASPGPSHALVSGAGSKLEAAATDAHPLPMLATALALAFVALAAFLGWRYLYRRERSWRSRAWRPWRHRNLEVKGRAGAGDGVSLSSGGPSSEKVIL